MHRYNRQKPVRVKRKSKHFYNRGQTNTEEADDAQPIISCPPRTRRVRRREGREVQREVGWGGRGRCMEGGGMGRDKNFISST